MRTWEKPTSPRTLRSVSAIEHRRSLLKEPHIAPLTEYAISLCERWGEVPFFDPFDGGTRAQVLFLFEKPGPLAASSGFISRDNDDPTAAATFGFMKAAGLERELTCSWNVVPGWDGTVRIAPGQLAAGLVCLDGLLTHFQQLGCIVLVGTKAQRAKLRLASRAWCILESYHPSPIVRATAPDKWAAIPHQWAAARACIGLGECVRPDCPCTEHPPDRTLIELRSASAT
jgi:hypothetical protein